jgi:hypothetical protein
MTKLLPWLRPRSAPLAELVDQHQHASNALAAAQEAVRAAKSDFDDEVNAASERALDAAKEAERVAQGRFERADRLLKAANAAKDAEERRAKERRREELQAILADVSRDRELTDTAVKAWLAVADAQVARAESELHLTRLDNELVGIEAELGVEEKWVRRNRLGAATHVIAEALRAECQGLPAGPRREVLHTLAFMLAPNWVR